MYELASTYWETLYYSTPVFGLWQGFKRCQIPLLLSTCWWPVIWFEPPCLRWNKA